MPRDPETMLDQIRNFFFIVQEEELDEQFGSDALVALMTNCSLAEGPEIAEKLVLDEYAACVNVFPAVKSYYMWQGEFQIDAETTLLIKTTEERVDELVIQLRKLHSYDTPEILMIKPDAVDERYAQWARERVGSGR